MVDGLHVGIIMDGNRRFAKRLMKEPWKGHEYGAKKFEEMLSWAKDAGVTQATIYTLSIQNLNRPKHEIDFLFKLFRKEIVQWNNNDSILKKEKLCVHFVGRLDLLPDDIQKSLSDFEESTKGNDGFIVNMCVAYGGREELTDAIYNLTLDVKKGKVSPMEVDSDLIESYLSVSSQPDLIIRTGGDIRTSNFLIWQSAYSEWFFLDKLWPELKREDFLNCIKEFKSRDRRFGK